MNKEQVIEALKSYFPKRWFKYDNSGIQRLLEVQAEAILMAVQTTEEVERELYSGSAVSTLADKERAYKLPVTSDMSVEERQRRLIAREWERGGPTNTTDFENTLSLLIGSPTKIIPDFNDFSMLLSFKYMGQKINFPIVEDYIRRNKLGHLKHIYNTELDKEVIKIRDKVVVTTKQYHKVKEFRVGMKPIKWKGDTILK
ncbi:DUF2313 domain-containing protein [Bacillus infantis]|uniref:DUF2313 domain-containing protein n=1 Tax=Bacillus infantis TaxID=324767 RepID=A0A5D4RXS1_9BACI|nr:putative phage tail protein [Bacillus infantis]TYS55740.1 DUF2313 domain-containing protein [Bacillus infantis]